MISMLVWLSFSQMGKGERVESDARKIPSTGNSGGTARDVTCARFPRHTFMSFAFHTFLNNPQNLCRPLLVDGNLGRS